MTTRTQRTVIAILLPIALASVAYAVHACLEYRKKVERAAEYLREKEQVERGRYVVERKPAPDEFETPPPHEGEYPRLYVPREMADMSAAERSALAADMIRFLGLDHTAPEKRYRAYITLVNCREAATAPLLRALNSENMREVYYALNACAHLRGLYHIDAGGETTFLDAALRIPADAPADVKTKLARLLGLYRDGRAATRLEELAADPDPSVRYRALLSLARVGRSDSLPAIAGTLEDDDPALLAAACRAMSAIAGYNVGDEFTAPPNYVDALSREVNRWRAWWLRNKKEAKGG